MVKILFRMVGFESSWERKSNSEEDANASMNLLEAELQPLDRNSTDTDLTYQNSKRKPRKLRQSRKPLQKVNV